MKSPFQLSRKMPFGFVAPFIERFTGLNTLHELYQHYTPSEDPAVCVRQALDILDISYTIKGNRKNEIPKTGPLIVVANHPFGGVDGVILIDMVLKVRPDLKVIVNKELTAIPDLRDMFIGMNIIKKSADGTDGKGNWNNLNEANRWVQQGGALILFPSGEVASWQWRYKKVTEAPWQKTVARLTQSTNANILPVFFEGGNSPVFHSLGLIHEKARTIWLARELIKKRGSNVSLHIGETITAREIASIKNKKTIANYLCLNTLLLGHTCEENKTVPSGLDAKKNKRKRVQEIVSCTDADAMARDINQIDKKFLLLEKNELQVWCIPFRKAPSIMREIGRLREVTFRQIGEGTGNKIDIDTYDDYYHHLFIWNTEKKEIVGAYRIGHVDDILKNKGLNGLYSHSLFGYQPEFLETLNPALEMGRSFIRQEYQKSLNILLLLWRGVGAYMAENPKYQVLFGPVSISSDYSEVSRRLIAECLMANNYDQSLASMMNPTRPYKPVRKAPWTTQHLYGIKQVELLSSLIKTIEGNKGIPILIKQYMKLRGEFAGFNIDKDFSDTLDGLIIVDTSRIDQKTLYKYMGQDKAKKFLTYHGRIPDNFQEKNRFDVA